MYVPAETRHTPPDQPDSHASHPCCSRLADHPARTARAVSRNRLNGPTTIRGPPDRVHLARHHRRVRAGLRRSVPMGKAVPRRWLDTYLAAPDRCLDAVGEPALHVSERTGPRLLAALLQPSPRTRHSRTNWGAALLRKSGDSSCRPVQKTSRIQVSEDRRARCVPCGSPGQR